MKGISLLVAVRRVRRGVKCVAWVKGGTSDARSSEASNDSAAPDSETDHREHHRGTREGTVVTGDTSTVAFLNREVSAAIAAAEGASDAAKVAWEKVAEIEAKLAGHPRIAFGEAMIAAQWAATAQLKANLIGGL